MPDNALALPDALSFVPARARADTRSRLTMYETWMHTNGYVFTTPNLEEYRDYLLDHRQASTVSNHLSTIRTRYKAIIRDSRFRDYLYTLAHRQYPAGSPADLSAVVNEFVVRIENAIDPESAKVKKQDKQDVADSQHMRLTPAEVSRYLKAIEGRPLEYEDRHGTVKRDLTRLLDMAMVALMLCTGVRREELVKLIKSDLRERLNGELALLVRNGKRNKQRMIPYGALDWCLTHVDAWMEAAGITGGNEYIFRGLTTDRANVRDNRMGLRTVNHHLGQYVIVLDNGENGTPDPHDLRRTYAKNFYLAFGYEFLPALQANLGHSKLATTMIYVGVDDTERRAPRRNIYEDGNERTINT